MPVKTSKPPVRGRRTKVEVQQEFADIHSIVLTEPVLFPIWGECEEWFWRCEE
jgi:hypothetical protein